MLNEISSAVSRVMRMRPKSVDIISEVDVPSPPGMDERVGNYVIRLSHLDAYNLEREPTFDEMAQEFAGNSVYNPFLSPLDRSDVSITSLTPGQAFWRENGYIIFRGAIPENVLNNYLAARERHGLGLGGWPTLHPFSEHQEVRDLVLHKPMMKKIQDIIGYPVAVHFNLSGFTSTDRGWHQDDYMYDRTVMASGVAAWIALDDITLDMGPFEYVPGSHRWRWMRRGLVTPYLKSEVVNNPDGKYEFWAHYAEKYVNPAVSRKIIELGALRRVFMAKRGDVLFWHGGLIHRGLPPVTPGIPRPSMIAHYLDPRRHDCGGTLQRDDSGEFYHSF